MTLLAELGATFLLVYAGLFPIVNPIGGALIFLALTRSGSDVERNRLALYVAANCFFLLVGSMFIGSYVLEFFGITLPVLRVAGGLVVTAAGWNLLQGGNADGATAVNSEAVKPVDSFYPLTMPITVGPGSLTVAISIASQRPHGDWAELALVSGAAAVGLLGITLTIYVCYRFAEATVGFLGEHGINVLLRLSAFILLCIGIQIFWSGLSTLLHIQN
jgi:multiple antibiotic resistance protein